MTANREKLDFTGYRLLLVEDTGFNREVIKDLLSIVNLKVECAENGKLAVEKFTNAAPGTYDLILMDIHMPVMNGYEAARAIRGLERADAGTVPIYAMTANTLTGDISEALACGMNGYIAKPIDTQILYTTIQQAVTERKKQDEEG